MEKLKNLFSKITTPTVELTAASLTLISVILIITAIVLICKNPVEFIVFAILAAIIALFVFCAYGIYNEILRVLRKN